MSHLIKLADKLSVCKFKISLISNIAAQNDFSELSAYSQNGICYILDEVVDSLENIQKKLIVTNKKTF